MKLFDIVSLSSLRGNMARCCDHARAGKNKSKPSRRDVIAEKHDAEKAERRKLAMEHARETLFPVRPFARVAAVRVIGRNQFRVAAGAHIPANAEITRGELCASLRARGFTGLRFNTGKRVLALS